MNKKINKRKKGFTLIELIIVIAIIAILSAIAIPKFATIRNNANITTDIANAKNIHSIVAQEIANEKISGTSASFDSTTSVVASAIDGGQLKSKVTGNVFTITVTDGNIVITSGTGNEVYPNQTGAFIKK